MKRSWRPSARLAVSFFALNLYQCTQNSDMKIATLWSTNLSTTYLTFLRRAACVESVSSILICLLVLDLRDLFRARSKILCGHLVVGCVRRITVSFTMCDQFFFTLRNGRSIDRHDIVNSIFVKPGGIQLNLDDKVRTHFLLLKVFVTSHRLIWFSSFCVICWRRLNLHL